ncbi:MAG: hypothetical protein ACOY71_13705 [Gemmatimonadota bacterium]
MSAIELRLLGPLDLRGPSRDLPGSLLRQPKRLALLAYLALGPAGRLHRRDDLHTLFWPDLDAEHGRAALRRALHFLRQEVGDDALVVGEDSVGLAEGAVWCDVRAFDAALDAGDREGALALYRGDLMAGCFVPFAPDVARWLDGERARLRARALAAGWRPDETAVRPAAPPGGELVAVLPFAVHGDPAFAYLGEGLMELVSIALDAAGDVRVVDPAMVVAFRASRGGSGADAVRTARRFGAELYLQGTLVETGGQLRATAWLRHTIDGKVAARAEAQCFDEAGLFTMVDDVVRQLLGSRHDGTTEPPAPVASLTTDSLPAIKAYLAGMQDFRRGSHFAALGRFGQAVARDPAFALAHFRQAASYAAGRLIDAAREASARAVAARDRLREPERLLVDAQQAWLDGRTADAELGYATAAAARPDAVEGWYMLGHVLFHGNPSRGRSIAEAREPLQRVLALDPGHVGALTRLARIAALEDRSDELRDLTDRAIVASPAGNHAPGMLALRAFASGRADERRTALAALEAARPTQIGIALTDVAVYHGDLAAAEAFGRTVIERARSDELRGLWHLMVAHLALARGRMAAACAELDHVDRLLPALAREVRALFTALRFLPFPDAAVEKALDALEHWDPSTAPAYAGLPLSLHNGLHAQLRAALLSHLAARRGDHGASVRWAEKLAELPVPDGAARVIERALRTLEARWLASANRLDEALRVIEGGAADVWYQHAVASPFYAGAADRLARATLLERAGREKEALAWFGAIAQHSVWELPFAAPAAFRMAAICERQGRHDAAAHHYRHAARLWRDCDPGLAPDVARALARAEALAAARP